MIRVARLARPSAGRAEQRSVRARFLTPNGPWLNRSAATTAPEAADIAAAPRPAAGAAAMAAGRAAGSLTRAAGSPAIERSSAEPGVTAAASGTTPAFRIRVRTSAAWA